MTWLVLKKKARGRQDYAVTGGGRARGVACRAPSAQHSGSQETGASAICQEC